MGDAAATAHFSIGSGTKLALESAIALAEYLHSEPTMQAAFRRYEDERRLEVLRLQSAARNSTEWFEEVERYLASRPGAVQLFAADPLAAHQPREPAPARPGVARRRGDGSSAQATGRSAAGCRAAADVRAVPPARACDLKNRVVVSPMAQYRAVDGTPTDWHLVHYAERAKGGAGLVFTEMTCVSPEGRITPGCTGLYAPEHEAAWKRIVDFVHAETDAKIAIQLGHSGAKGSTQLGWEEMDAPLPAGNWQVMAPSPCLVAGQPDAARAMTRADMDTVRDAVRARRGNGRARRLRHARAALRARLSAVGLHHAAHQPAHG